jgi:hypothetical protein
LNLKGLDRKAVATRLDWLVANNPHLALDRLHAKGSRDYRDEQYLSSPSGSIISSRDPIPGKDSPAWVTEFFARDQEAVLRVCLVGDDCYFVVSHVLGDFTGVLALCEFILLGGDDSHLVDLKPAGFPVIARAVARNLRRHPVPMLRANAAILGKAVRALFTRAVDQENAKSTTSGPIRLICWPKPARDGMSGSSESKRKSPPNAAKVVACALRAAADLGIRYHTSVSVLVDCRHWLDSSRRPLLGNLASVTSIDVSSGVRERDIIRQLTRDFRGHSPLIRLMLSHVYGGISASFKRRNTANQAPSESRSDVLRMVITNLGAIRMMDTLRKTFPEAKFSGTPAMPIEGYSTIVIYTDMGVEEVGIISNSQLTADDAYRWRDRILEMLRP